MRHDANLVSRLCSWVLGRLLGPAEGRCAASELEELQQLRASKGNRSSGAAWLGRQLIHYIFRLTLEHCRTRPRRPLIPPDQALHTPSRSPMRNLWIDARQNFKSLLKAPLLSATIIATVGLGIGTTTVLSGVVYSVLIAPLPYQEPDRLVRIFWARGPFRAPFSVVDFQALQQRQSSFEQVEGYTWMATTFHRGDVAERIRGKRVSPGYFSLLGIGPARGRSFLSGEGRPGSEPAVIASQSFWNSYLGGDPAVVGETIDLDGVPHRLIGVLGSDPGPLESASELFIATEWPAPERRGPFFIHVVGRLAPGVQPAAALAEVQAINEQIFPLWQSSYQDSATEWGVIDLKESLVGTQGPRLYLSLAAVALVLLIACANAANLLVARAGQRQRELAIRRALGASRARLLQHLLSESGLLAAGSVAVALAVSAAGLRLVATVGAPYIPRAAEVSFNAPTLLVLASATLLSGALFGLLPSLVGARARLSRGLSSTRSASPGPATRRLRQGLVVTQVAVATPLLIAAALLANSLANLQKVDLGVTGGQVLTAATLLPARSYPEGSDVLAFWERAQDRLEALAGVESVGYSDGRPPAETSMANNFFLEDHPTPPGEADPAVPWVAATPGYFEAMGITLLKGRLLDDRDGGEGLDSLVVDRAWERRFFPDSGAVGRRVRQGGCPTCPFATVVGVVSDVRYEGLIRPPEGTVYWSMADRPTNHAIEGITQRFRYFVIRTSVEPLSLLPQVRSLLRELDPTLPLSRIATIEELAAGALQQPRDLSVLVGAFAAVALLLSVIGIYGVMSYFVQQHTSDIGIRMALGDRPAAVVGWVVRRGMKIVVVGLVVGVAAALALTRFMSSLLFEVGPTDTLAFLAVPALILAAALTACLLPARRAAGIDPARMLRAD